VKKEKEEEEEEEEEEEKQREASSERGDGKFLGTYQRAILVLDI
jgi:hypothetical protein